MKNSVYLTGLFALATTLFAADPLFGTWKFNPAKSTGPALPKDGTIVREDRGETIHSTAIATRADGTPASSIYDYPKAGGKGQVSGTVFDEVSMKRLTNNSFDLIFMKDGKAVRTNHVVVSNDGKSMTVTATGVDMAGKPLSAPQKNVYDKQ